MDMPTLTAAHKELERLVGTRVGEKDRYRFRMEMSHDGARWATFMEGDYQRTG